MSPAIRQLFANGAIISLSKEQALFRSGEAVHSMFLVVDGQVDLVRHLRSGLRMVLFRGIADQVLAEASAYSDSYHCDGIAAVPSHVRAIPVKALREALHSDVRLANSWAERLAHGLQGARLNAEIRTLRTVAERLEAWQLVNGTLPAKGQWQCLAQTLGVSPAALYRELARHRPLPNPEVS